MLHRYFSGPMPDCVPEYYRSRQEKTGHRYELQMQRQEIYKANRQKIAAAVASGLPILCFGGYGLCWDCPDADHDTMTDDDMCRVICRDPACPHYRKHQSVCGSSCGTSGLDRTGRALDEIAGCECSG